MRKRIATFMLSICLCGVAASSAPKAKANPDSLLALAQTYLFKDYTPGKLEKLKDKRDFTAIKKVQAALEDLLESIRTAFKDPDINPALRKSLSLNAEKLDWRINAAKILGRGEVVPDRTAEDSLSLYLNLCPEKGAKLPAESLVVSSQAISAFSKKAFWRDFGEALNFFNGHPESFSRGDSCLGELLFLDESWVLRIKEILSKNPEALSSLMRMVKGSEAKIRLGTIILQQLDSLKDLSKVPDSLLDQYAQSYFLAMSKLGLMPQLLNKLAANVAVLPFFIQLMDRLDISRLSPECQEMLNQFVSSFRSEQEIRSAMGNITGILKKYAGTDRQNEALTGYLQLLKGAGADSLRVGSRNLARQILAADSIFRKRGAPLAISEISVGFDAGPAKKCMENVSRFVRDTLGHVYRVVTTVRSPAEDTIDVIPGNPVPPDFRFIPEKQPQKDFQLLALTQFALSGKEMRLLIYLVDLNSRMVVLGASREFKLNSCPDSAQTGANEIVTRMNSDLAEYARLGSVSRQFNAGLIKSEDVKAYLISNLNIGLDYQPAYSRHQFRSFRGLAFDTLFEQGRYGRLHYPGLLQGLKARLVAVYAGHLYQPDYQDTNYLVISSEIDSVHHRIDFTFRAVREHLFRVSTSFSGDPLGNSEAEADLIAKLLVRAINFSFDVVRTEPGSPGSLPPPKLMDASLKPGDSAILDAGLVSGENTLDFDFHWMQASGNPQSFNLAPKPRHVLMLTKPGYYSYGIYLTHGQLTSPPAYMTVRVRDPAPIPVRYAWAGLFPAGLPYLIVGNSPGLPKRLKGFSFMGLQFTLSILGIVTNGVAVYKKDRSKFYWSYGLFTGAALTGIWSALSFNNYANDVNTTQYNDDGLRAEAR